MLRRSLRPTAGRAWRVGFTLVELLVVIGIIALLIGILLPALSNARRAAQTVKCGAAMQQIGIGFQLYSNEYKGYWPPSRMTAPASGYSIGDDTFTSGQGIYWYNFISPFVSASKMGFAAGSGYDAATARKKNILWGCPAFEGYSKYNVQAGDDVNAAQTGYAMNAWPGYKADDMVYDPIGPYPVNDDQSQSNTLSYGGHWWKQSQYMTPAARCLVADGRVYSAESLKVTNPDGEAVGKQNPAAWATQLFTDNNQTTIDIFRHGKNPGVDSSGNFSTSGGKVLYNILYCDGHVAQTTHGSDAFLSIRQRFPG